MNTNKKILCRNKAVRLKCDLIFFFFKRSREAGSYISSCICFFITTLQKVASVQLRCLHRILNLAWTPGTAPGCGFTAAKPNEDGSFPALHFSYPFTRQSLLDHHHPLAVLTRLVLYIRSCTNKSSNWLKLKNAWEHPSIFCFVVHIPLYSQPGSVKSQSWRHGWLG